MADHISDVLIELEAADNAITPSIEGMKYLINDNVSLGLKEEFEGEIVDRERRQDLIRNAIAALQELIDDGYPTLEQEPLPQALYDEWQTYLANVEASKNVFILVLASSAKISLGEFTDKPVE